MDPQVEIRGMVEPLEVFVRRFYRDSYDAEDLVQETLLRALANIDSYTPGTRMKSWLFTIMRNTFYSRSRIYDREKPAAAECVSERGSSAATQDIAVEYMQVLASIQGLPLDQKEVVILIAILGISYHDASEICRCQLGTVQSRLYRARTRLGNGSAAAWCEPTATSAAVRRMLRSEVSAGEAACGDRARRHERAVAHADAGRGREPTCRARHDPSRARQRREAPRGGLPAFAQCGIGAPVDDRSEDPTRLSEAEVADGKRAELLALLFRRNVPRKEEILRLKELLRELSREGTLASPSGEAEEAFISAYLDFCLGRMTGEAAIARAGLRRCLDCLVVSGDDEAEALPPLQDSPIIQ